MAVAQAEALVPELGIREAELEADAAALEKLALWALRRYSPLVAADPPDGLAMPSRAVIEILCLIIPLHGRPRGNAICLQYTGQVEDPPTKNYRAIC
jgi:hypothetical protein